MDVQEALRGLGRAADDGVDGAVPPPAGDLWQRGERWQRSRRRGTATVAALGVVVLALLSVVTVHATAPPQPVVAPGSAPTLPDRVYDISPWGEVGVPGEQVVAARLTERSTWTGSVPAIAVLTGSGRYLYVDAPAISEASEGEAALAPDGRHLAYWATGSPSGTPNTHDGQVVPITGVAVLDVVTGAVERHRIPTEHGLQPEGLLWADADSLVGSQMQRIAGDDGSDFDRNVSNDFAAWQWTPGDGDTVRMLDPDVFEELDSFAEASGGRVLLRRDLIDLRTGMTQRVERLSSAGSVGFSGSNAFLRGDGTLAQVSGSRTPNHVTLQRLDDPAGRTRTLPGSEDTWQVLGWREDDLLVTRETTGPGLHDVQQLSIVALDVSDGTSETVLRGGDQLLGWTWATDLLSAPVVDGVEPASPEDPRVVLGTALTVVLLTVGGLVVWRRRGRP